MSLATQARLLRVDQTVIGQVDFFQGDGFTRVAGLTVGDLSSRLFFDNVLQPWSLINGATVGDALISAGGIYFNEIGSAPGHYSVRFRPNVVGYWRLVLSYAAGQQIVAHDYDVTVEPLSKRSGLKASFV